MIILNHYRCETPECVIRHYVQVQLENGRIAELGAKENLSDADWLSLAEKTITEPKLAPTAEIEAEDGTVI